MAINFVDGKYVNPENGRVTLDPTMYADWQIAEEAEKTLPPVDFFRQKLGLLEEMAPDAQAALRNQAAIAKIAELENITATDEEIGQAIALVARQNNMTVEQLKPYMNEDFHKAIVNSVQTGKVMALIREHAAVTEV